MGKVLLASGILLILLFVLAILAAALPTDWLFYVLDKITSLISGEPRHIYIKVVPGSSKDGYFLVTAIGVMGVVLSYYGVKLIKNGRK